VLSLARVVNSQVRTCWKTASTSRGTTSVAIFDLPWRWRLPPRLPMPYAPLGSLTTVPGSLRVGVRCQLPGGQATAGPLLAPPSGRPPSAAGPSACPARHDRVEGAAAIAGSFIEPMVGTLRRRFAPFGRVWQAPVHGDFR
jgi:hypothetical protein